METCATCTHLVALHAGRTEHCRLNGCRCQAFRPIARPVTLASDTPDVANPSSTVSLGAFTAILSGLAFAAGLLLGLSL